MGCIFLILVLAFPRLVLALMFLFSNYLGTAYNGILVPLLGFIFLPITTITYAWLVNSNLPMEGFNLFLLVLAAVLDVGSWGGGEYHRRRV